MRIPLFLPSLTEKVRSDFLLDEWVREGIQMRY